LELLLDVELGLVDEGLLLQVEVVLGLDADLVSLLVRLLEDEVDLLLCYGMVGAVGRMTNDERRNK